MRFETDLESVLEQIDSLNWELETYIPDKSVVAKETRVLVIDDEAEERRDEIGEPLHPAEIGFKPFLSVADLQDVKDNLIKQKPSATVINLIQAIRYYLDNDAFICISQKSFD